MAHIAVIIPTLGRPQSLEGVARNVRESGRLSAVFVIEKDDSASAAEASRLREMGLADYVVNARARTYAGAVNSAIRKLLGHDDLDYFFLGADDLHFWPDWDTAALAKSAETRAMVIGTNDMHNPYVMAGTHATHYLVHRSYVSDPRYTYDPGIAGQVLFEGYGHNFTDAEFIGAATAAGVFTPCLEAVVEHRHPDWNLSPWDDTYAKGRVGLHEDLALFRSREHLWTTSPAHPGDYEMYCQAK